MLDLYLIADQTRPNNTEALPYAGGLEEDIFQNLQHKDIISERFDVYSTFRWGTDLIQQMRQTIQKKNMSHDADVQQLAKLFDVAQKNNCGLMAYGD